MYVCMYVCIVIYLCIILDRGLLRVIAESCRLSRATLFQESLIHSFFHSKALQTKEQTLFDFTVS